MDCLACEGSHNEKCLVMHLVIATVHNCTYSFAHMPKHMQFA